jgi:caffeoyl-CoA O-methyltransferase
MIRRLFLGSTVAAALPACAQRGGQRAAGIGQLSAPNDPTEEKIQAVIRQMATEGGTYLSVPVNDGQWLRILTESSNAKRVVEVGTSTGFSGLFFCLALAKTGGQLITHDIDQGRFQRAKANFEKAGVSDRVTQVLGDARDTLKRLKDPIDIVFLDADKDGYVQYLDILLPLVREGGLILAHNTGMVRDYLDRVQGVSSLETVIYRAGSGLSVTLKKRS